MCDVDSGDRSPELSEDMSVEEDECADLSSHGLPPSVTGRADSISGH